MDSNVTLLGNAIEAISTSKKQQKQAHYSLKKVNWSKSSSCERAASNAEGDLTLSHKAGKAR